MGSTIDEIKKLLTASNLSHDEQLELLDIFSFAKDEELGVINELLKKRPDLATDLYQNLKAKREALKGDDSKKINQILEDEGALLNKLEAEDN